MSEPIRKTELRPGAGARAAHDVGGLDLGPIDLSDHDPALWEKRVDAMLILLVGARKAAFRIDAMRRVIEDYGAQTYDRTTYYEKWIRAVRNLLVEQDILTAAQIEAKIAEVEAALVAEGRAVSGDRVPWEAGEAAR